MSVNIYEIVLMLTIVSSFLSKKRSSPRIGVKSKVFLGYNVSVRKGNDEQNQKRAASFSSLLLLPSPTLGRFLPSRPPVSLTKNTSFSCINQA